MNWPLFLAKIGKYLVNTLGIQRIYLNFTIICIYVIILIIPSKLLYYNFLKSTEFRIVIFTPKEFFGYLTRKIRISYLET